MNFPNPLPYSENPPLIGTWEPVLLQVPDEIRPGVTHPVTTRTFIPNPLAESAELRWTPERATLLAEASYWLGKTAVRMGDLPKSDMLCLSASFVRKEAVYSSRIEGTKTTLADYLAFESGDIPDAGRDASEVRCNVEALYAAYDSLRGGYPVVPSLIKALHAKLLSYEGADRFAPGSFRDVQNFVGKNGETPEERVKFVPPPPGHVAPAMESLCDFIERNGNLDPLVIGALTHALFEIIHPFRDGNGRIGRILIPMVLMRRGKLLLPALPISLILKENRAEYYRLLSEITDKNEWEAWLDFFLRSVISAARVTELTIDRYLALLEQDRVRFRNEKGNDFRIWRHLLQHPVCSVAQASSDLGITTVQAYKIFERLEKEKMVFLLPKQSGKASKTYAYIGMFSVLREKIVFNGEPFVYDGAAAVATGDED